MRVKALVVSMVLQQSGDQVERPLLVSVAKLRAPHFEKSVAIRVYHFIPIISHFLGLQKSGLDHQIPAFKLEFQIQNISLSLSLHLVPSLLGLTGQAKQNAKRFPRGTILQFIERTVMAGTRVLVAFHCVAGITVVNVGFRALVKVVVRTVTDEDTVHRAASHRSGTDVILAQWVVAVTKVSAVANRLENGARAAISSLTIVEALTIGVSTVVVSAVPRTKILILADALVKAGASVLSAISIS